MIDCGPALVSGGAALVLAFASPALGQEKSAEDPTRIATKVGVSYSDEASVSGSFAFGERFKVNGRISESGMWSAGASYLFPIAILTFSASRSQFDSGIEQTRYSLGGFVPLSQTGLDTGKWSLFVPFGYTKTNGSMPESEEDAVTDIDVNEGFPVELSSNSGYVGLFALRPINDRLTFMTGANITRGSNDFSGVAASAGLSYHLGAKDTLGLNVSYVDNTFGAKQKLGISYRHEF